MATEFPCRGEIHLASMRTQPGARNTRPVLVVSPDVRIGGRATLSLSREDALLTALEIYR